MPDLDKIIGKFLNEETQQSPSVFSYIQTLSEMLGNFSPKTVREQRSLEIARRHINEIRRLTKQTLRENEELREKVQVLEEEKTHRANK